MVGDGNLLNNKTIILLNLAEYPLIEPTRPTASSAKYQVIFRAISQDNYQRYSTLRGRSFAWLVTLMLETEMMLQFQKKYIFP